MRRRRHGGRQRLRHHTTTEPPSDGDGEGDVDGDGDGSDGESGDATTTTEPVELTASWTGVTEEVIRLGFTTSDLIQLKELGLVDIDRGDPQVVLDTLVADVNARGGIQGRMIEPYLEVLLPIDATAADAACVRMTEDVGVFAVLAPFVGPNTDLNPCINSRNETIIVGGQPDAEQLEVAAAPWISNNMFSARRLAGVIELMEADSLLGDSVGVVVRSEEINAADDIVIPALDALDGAVAADLDGIIGSAGLSEAESWALDATQDCVRVFEEAYPDITVVPTTEVPEGESDWFGNINVFCPVLRLFELVANASGPELTHESFLAGAESLGEIEIPGQVFASLGPDKYDAADAIRLTVFDQTVGENGGEAPRGELQAVG